MIMWTTICLIQRRPVRLCLEQRYVLNATAAAVDKRKFLLKRLYAWKIKDVFQNNKSKNYESQNYKKTFYSDYTERL